MHEHTECPKCGNDQILRYVEEIIGKDISVKTGKVIRNYGFQGTNSWNYKCRCGWFSELSTD